MYSSYLFFFFFDVKIKNKKILILKLVADEIAARSTNQEAIKEIKDAQKFLDEMLPQVWKSKQNKANKNKTIKNNK